MSQSSKRILVTGGAGFVGTRFVTDLVEAGHDVHVVDDCSVGSPDRLPAGVTVDEVDVRSRELEPALQSYDPHAIVHMAAIHYVPYCDEHPGETYDVNVLGTRTLLDAARTLDTLETVVNVSSAAVYPPLDGPLSEDVRPGPMDPYGKSKLVGEELVNLFGERTDVDTVSARLFNVYGPGETNPHLIPAILDQLRDGSRTVELGNLTPRRDYVHVRDVSRALQRLVDHADDAPPALNVGTGDAHSVRAVVEAVSLALGEDIEVTQDQERVRASDRPHLQADIERMSSVTGWTPTVGLVDGLAELLVMDGVEAT
ncbi:NAD-dependent epimerase/dehydratase family protein [Haloarchaeobius litoreus]|uniref:NAD-dependent epimerase/dehydratase family protein n=1 Tax=Haloarchaeobius litoreus TaxID=755306 RepID=A0ABD6DNP8_9EURY|nr:NAD-dependent epimerase/dehydratase family protein [Haloarchaeobius litoreus]